MSSEDQEISLSSLKTMKGKDKAGKSPEMSLGGIPTFDPGTFKNVVLLIIKGAFSGRKYRADEPISVRLGRDAGCEICIPKEADSMISRQHCRIDVRASETGIFDLGSRNGTFVNGKKVASDLEGCLLKSGDTFQIGVTVFKVQIEEKKTVNKNNVITKMLEKYE